MHETQVQSLGGEDPLEKEMETHSNILGWRIHGQRSLVDYSPWGHEESDMTDTLTFAQQRAIFSRLAFSEHKNWQLGYFSLSFFKILFYVDDF